MPIELSLYEKTNFINVRFIIPTIFLALATVQPAVSQKPDWKGTVVNENNVKVIRNPRMPLYGALKLDLQQDLSIGREDDKNYLFWSITDVQIDAVGNIYVVDMRNLRIQKFDRTGRFLTTIGRKGQGPGEFQQPSFARIDPRTGNIFVRDAVISILSFDKDGRSLAKMTWGKVICDFYPTDGGEFLAVLDRPDEKNLAESHCIVKIGADGKIIRTLAEYPYTIFIERIGEGIASIKTGYELDAYLAKMDGNTFIYGYSKDYELTVINAEGAVLSRIVKDTPLPSFSAAEKAQFRKHSVPKNYPYFFRILTDLRGRIYVQRNFTYTGRSTVQDAIPKEVDVFSREGHFLYTTTLPPNTTVIRDGYIYAFLIDEENGLESVKRYKIRNWDRIMER